MISSPCRKVRGRALTVGPLRKDGKPILAFTQGKQRSYVYPLFTPAGYPVTTECPADHRITIPSGSRPITFTAACRSRTAATKIYTTTSIVDETFQGRAPGQIVETDIKAEADRVTMRFARYPVAGMARPGRVGGPRRAYRCARNAHTSARPETQHAYHLL